MYSYKKRSTTSYVAWTMMVLGIGLIIGAGVSKTAEFAYGKIGSPGHQFFASIKNATLSGRGVTLPSNSKFLAESIDYNSNQPIVEKASDNTGASFAVPADEDTVRLGWVGDISPYLIESQTNTTAVQPFAGVENLLSLPDLMMGNLEGVLTNNTESKCKTTSTNCFAFRGDIGFAKVLRDGGFDLMNLANNHAFDFGKESFVDTQNALASVSIRSTGTPETAAVYETKGVKIAVLGFSPNIGTNQMLATTSLVAQIKKAKAEADIVIVLVHAGAEGVQAIHTPDEDEVYLGEHRGNILKIAHTAVDAGADMVLGSGPHVLRGMERYNGKLIAYSLGNFLAHDSLSTRGLLSVSGILMIDIKKDGTVSEATLVPVYLDNDGFPQIDPVGTAFPLINKLSRDDFGDNAVTISDTGIIEQ